MSNYEINTKVKRGRISLKDIPLPDNTDVKVVVIPKIKLEQLSLKRVRELTKSIPGNLSDDISEDRI